MYCFTSDMLGPWFFQLSDNFILVLCAHKNSASSWTLPDTADFLWVLRYPHVDCLSSGQTRVTVDES